MIEEASIAPIHFGIIGQLNCSIILKKDLKSLPPWINIENCSVPLPLPQYIYSAKAEMLKKKTKNPILRNMIIIWYQVKKYLGEPSSLSRFSPIWGNQFFPPGRADSGFRK